LPRDLYFSSSIHDSLLLLLLKQWRGHAGRRFDEGGGSLLPLTALRKYSDLTRARGGGPGRIPMHMS
jgi:hypothetical protein